MWGSLLGFEVGAGCLWFVIFERKGTKKEDDLATIFFYVML